MSAALNADEATQSLETQILEEFDVDATSKWIAVGSKFTFTEKDTSGKDIVYPLVKEVTTYPEAVYGFTNSEENKARKALGILSKFSRPGYNYIEVFPVKEATSETTEKDIIRVDSITGKKYVANPIHMPGRIKIFDVWVWGSNHNYYMEAHFEDSWGMPHVLKLGDLRYYGWKNLSIQFPTSIRQSSEYLPRFRPLKFVKFVIWTRPTEKVDECYIYIDHLKVLTDIFEQRFDGDLLADPKFSGDLWGKGSGQ
jgi:hypothetical protein